MVKVEELTAQAGRTKILHGVSLDVKAGGICCVMGKNGSGKSTLLNSLMGHPAYRVDASVIDVLGKSIKERTATEKSNLGMFQSFQSPPDFPEITGFECLEMITENMTKPPSTQKLNRFKKDLMITDEMLARPLNVGFSGGERKRMEILQMLVCNPKVVLLDEIDTGLDVDSMILIGNTIRGYVKKSKATVLIVTHYFRFLEYIPPTQVVVLDKGAVVATGSGKLAEQIDKNGYSSLNK